MLDSIVKFYDNLPFLIRWVVWFWFNIILLRGFIASDINSYLKEKGFMKNGFIHPLQRFVHRLLPARMKTIWSHYKLQALGIGHRAEHVFNCAQDECATL